MVPRKYLADNFDHRYVFTDITKRNHKKLKTMLLRDNQHPDLYTAGWPCQPFSIAGQLKGADDSRGDVGPAVMDTINVIQPKSFVLENVPGVLTNPKFRPFLMKMLKPIRSLKAGDVHVW